MNVTAARCTWIARLRAAKAMLADAPGRQAEIDGCCAAIAELGMVRSGSTIRERMARVMDDLNHCFHVNDAQGYVVALTALLALARCDMEGDGKCT